MKSKIVQGAAALLVSVWICGASTAAADKLRVAATLSSYADIAKEIGGEFVETSYVASPRFDPHFIEPRPSDVLKVKRCDLFIHSGLDLEAWRDPLIDATGRGDLRAAGDRQLDLSRDIQLLEVPDHNVSRAEGDIHLFGNPHYSIDPRNGVIIAQEIAGKLAQIDPAHAVVYQKNLEVFATRLNTKIEAWRTQLQPCRGRKLVGYHNGWVYLMAFAEMKMEAFLEPKPGIPPTPKQLETVLGYIAQNHVPAIVQASYSTPDAAASLAAQTGVKVLTLSQNVGDVPEASDYIAMLYYDVNELAGVCRQ